MSKRTKKNLSFQIEQQNTHRRNKKVHKKNPMKLQKTLSENKLDVLLKNSMLVLDIIEKEINIKREEKGKNQIFKITKSSKERFQSDNDHKRESLQLDENNRNHIPIIDLKRAITNFQEIQNSVNPFI